MVPLQWPQLSWEGKSSSICWRAYPHTRMKMDHHGCRPKLATGLGPTGSGPTTRVAVAWAPLLWSKRGSSRWSLLAGPALTPPTGRIPGPLAMWGSTAFLRTGCATALWRRRSTASWRTPTLSLNWWGPWGTPFSQSSTWGATWPAGPNWPSPLSGSSCKASPWTRLPSSTSMLLYPLTAHIKVLPCTLTTTSMQNKKASTKPWPRRTPRTRLTPFPCSWGGSGRTRGRKWSPPCETGKVDNAHLLPASSLLIEHCRSCKLISVLILYDRILHSGVYPRGYGVSRFQPRKTLTMMYIIAWANLLCACVWEAWHLHFISRM